MTQWHSDIHTDLKRKKRSSGFFSKKNRHVFDHESYDGTPEIPHEFFFKQIAGTFAGLSSSWWEWLWIFDGFFQPIWNGEKSSPDFFFGGVYCRWLVHDWISKTSIKAISRPFSHDPFGCRNHHRPKNEINSREPPGTPKPTIGCFNQFHDEPNLYIGNVWNAPNFHLSIGKTGWISGAPGRA